jgi:hypothetical protein
MQSDEGAPVIFGRKILAFIEHDLEGSRVGLDEHIRNGYAALQVGVLAFMTRIFVAADVKPWPAIEGAFLDISRVIKGSVISEAISLIDDCP